jgi:hypothetical protein
VAGYEHSTKAELRIFPPNFAIKLRSTMSTDLTLDLSFPHSYSLIQLHELPGDGRNGPIYFPGLTTRGGGDGPLFRFTCSNGKQWSGCFAFGNHKFSGVFATPNPDRVCVVSKGEGYWVDVNEPEKSSTMNVFPIRDVRVVIEARILLIANFSVLYAFGPDGRLWAEEVCGDDLKIQEIEGNIVRGVGYDPRNGNQTRAEFAVELATGRVLESPWL